MDKTNITQAIRNRMGKNLHLQKNHPIEIIKRKIYDYFGDKFSKHDNLNPVVNIKDNFDALLIPKNHPARSKSDTYYVDNENVLRTHTSAHQNELLKKGFRQFLVTGDVYRKDEIDSHHYPVFHQMEGVCIVPNEKDCESELKNVLVGLVKHLFPGCNYKISDDYFPFTHPSYEMEVEYNGKWLEILGCGVMQPEILKNCGYENTQAWAFGLGLERLAMILFDIPDIRLFWCTDPEFISQFSSGEIIKYKPYPVLQPITKDVCFWIEETSIVNDKWILENDFFEICRSVAGDVVERVELFDKFLHPKIKKYSYAYHVRYSPPTVTMNNPGEFNTIANNMQEEIIRCATETLKITLRSKTDSSK